MPTTVQEADHVPDAPRRPQGVHGVDLHFRPTQASRDATIRTHGLPRDVVQWSCSHHSDPMEHATWHARWGSDALYFVEGPREGRICHRCHLRARERRRSYILLYLPPSPTPNTPLVTTVTIAPSGSSHAASRRFAERQEVISESTAAGAPLCSTQTWRRQDV
jgi:hypothetical protein